MSTIKITIKTVYGKELMYPMDEKGKLFASLVGRKTLTAEHLELIKALGYTIELVNGYTLNKGD